MTSSGLDEIVAGACTCTQTFGFRRYHTEKQRAPFRQAGERKVQLPGPPGWALNPGETAWRPRSTAAVRFGTMQHARSEPRQNHLRTNGKGNLTPLFFSFGGLIQDVPFSALSRRGCGRGMVDALVELFGWDSGRKGEGLANLLFIDNGVGPLALALLAPLAEDWFLLLLELVGLVAEVGGFLEVLLDDGALPLQVDLFDLAVDVREFRPRTSHRFEPDSGGCFVKELDGLGRQTSLNVSL